MMTDINSSSSQTMKILQQFPKAKMYPFVFTNPGQKLQFLQSGSESYRSQDIMICQGQNAEVGIELVSFDSNVLLDESWLINSQLMRITIQLSDNLGDSIFRESSFSQSYLSSSNLDSDHNSEDTNTIIVTRTLRGIFFSVVTSFRISGMLTNIPLLLSISFSIEVPSSISLQSLGGSDFVVARKIVDCSKIKVPRLPTKEINLRVTIIDPIVISQLVRPLPCNACLLTITITNKHPHRNIYVQDILLHLNRTVLSPRKSSIEIKNWKYNHLNTNATDVLESIAHSIVMDNESSDESCSSEALPMEEWINCDWLTSPRDILLVPFQCHTFAVRITSRHPGSRPIPPPLPPHYSSGGVVDILGSVRQSGKPKPSTSSSMLLSKWTRLVNDPAVAFATPMTVVWVDFPLTTDKERPVTPSESTAMQLLQQTVQWSFFDLSDCLSRIEKECDAMGKEMGSVGVTGLWVDLTGPAVAHVGRPFILQVNIQNCSDHTYHLVISWTSTGNDAGEGHDSREARRGGRSEDGSEEAQFVAVDQRVWIGEMAPGSIVNRSLTLLPLSRGRLRASRLQLMDGATNGSSKIVYRLVTPLEALIV